MDIFVGSIPFKFKEKDLSDLFEPFGTVSDIKIIISNITRQNKGFGFVTMSNEEEAKNAIKELNGKEFEGRNIVVQKAEGSTEQMTKKLMRHGSSPYGGKGGAKVSASKGSFAKGVNSGGRKGGGMVPKVGNRGS